MRYARAFPPNVGRLLLNRPTGDSFCPPVPPPTPIHKIATALRSQIFTILPLLESIVVFFLFYREEAFTSKLLRLMGSRLAHASMAVTVDTRESASAGLYRSFGCASTASNSTATVAATQDRDATQVVPVRSDMSDTAASVALLMAASVCAEPPPLLVGEAKASASAAGMTDAHAERLIFYERLFFALELKNTTDDGQFVAYEEVDRFLSFVAFELTASERTKLIVDCQDERLASLHETREFYRQQLMHITRPEFVKICLLGLHSKSIEAINTAASTFRSAQKLRRSATSNRMRRTAQVIDAYFRRIGLPSYLISLLGLVLAFEAVDEQSVGTHVRVVPSGLAATLAFLLGWLLLSVGWQALQYKLVRDTHEATATRIVDLLAAQKHGPGLTRLLDKLAEAPEPERSVRFSLSSKTTAIAPAATASAAEDHACEQGAAGGAQRLPRAQGVSQRRMPFQRPWR